MADDYIKREDAIKAIKSWASDHVTIGLIEKIASADVAPVVHGEWIKKPHWIPLPWDCEPSLSADPDDYDRETHSEKVMWWHCSCCGYSPDRGWKPHLNYCPICGAKMDGGT